MSLIEAFLKTTHWTDLCINPQPQQRIEGWIDRGEGLCRLEENEIPFSGTEAVRSWVFDQLNRIGKSWDAKNPFFDFRHPTGARVHAVLPPLSPHGITLSIRKLGFYFSPLNASLTSSKDLPWIKDPFYSLLCLWVKEGKAGMIAGGTGSGKTTLLNSLLSEVPPHERILALEDTPELYPKHPGFLALQTRLANAEGKGEVTLRDLLKQTLRMRPDRIILGECRGAEVIDLLQILNTGHRGALATLHAQSARDALRRIELLCHLATEGRLSHSVLRELLSHGFQWIAHVEKHSTGRRITEVLEIKGREGDSILTRSLTPLPRSVSL